jgi:protein-L-isoaspartate(D-aspartate) O-methyltransferase
VFTSEPVATAFAAVPRETFLAQGFHGRNGARINPDDAGFLDAVYSDEPLVTKRRNGVPVSSSSQPSLMALMLEALHLAPDMRVLEIGAGTGYNAALMAAIGARVTSIDVQPDVVDRARGALASAGVTSVDVRLGDGYLGEESGAPYDRVVVTVGVTGVSPHWLDQLLPGGSVLAPVVHAGTHPVLRVQSAPGDTIRAQGICPSGFMSATGPLAARYPWAHPEPRRTNATPARVSHPGRWKPPLDLHRYYDLWFAAGAWDRRVTAGAVPGAVDAGGCTLLDEIVPGRAMILSDGGITASGERAEFIAGEAVALVERWLAAGRPQIADWWGALALAGDPDHPIWVPRDWSLDPPP